MASIKISCCNPTCNECFPWDSSPCLQRPLTDLLLVKGGGTTWLAIGVDGQLIVSWLKAQTTWDMSWELRAIYSSLCVHNAYTYIYIYFFFRPPENRKETHENKSNCFLFCGDPCHIPHPQRRLLQTWLAKDGGTDQWAVHLRKIRLPERASQMTQPACILEEAALKNIWGNVNSNAAKS